MGYQIDPSVAGLADGGFMVAWNSNGSSGTDSSSTSIQGQRYAADGTALGEELQINSYTTFSQTDPSVAGLVDGGFVVTWESTASGGSDTSYASIQGQRHAADGTALGAQFQVNSACHGGDNQVWRLDLTSLPQEVVGVGGKCLVPGIADAGGDIPITVGPCDGDATLWRLAEPAHAEPSTLNLSGTDLCLDVEGGAGDDATPAILSECHGGAGQLWRPAAEVCTRDSLGLCLNQERFRVDLKWRSFDDTTGSGRAVLVGSDDSGLLWFFETDNWELLIKLLDGCDINDRLWVFAAATTTVEYTLRVTDTRTGVIREYTNPLGDAAAAITDTDAFATCPAGAAVIEDPPAVASAVPEPRSIPAANRLKGSCLPIAHRMCLTDDRFELAGAWRDYAGNTGPARVVDAGSADDTSGLFWFFNSDNWELLVKVIDACDVNGRFLFLGAATTDVEYTLTVTDTATGVYWQHTNPQGNPSAALVHWFDTCP